MKRLIVRALVLLTLAVGGVAVIQAPAQASWSDCVLNRFCIWTGESATGSSQSWNVAGMYNGQCTNIGILNNSARSAYLNVFNHYTVRLWTGANCTGLAISTMWDGTYNFGDCLGAVNWYTVASPCNAPTASSFRYYF